MLAQHVASEGWEVQPDRSPAHGTRTISMCAFDARNRESITLPLKMNEGIGKTRALGIIPATSSKDHMWSLAAALLGTRRVSARLGWAGEMSGLFEHPETVLISPL